MGMNMNFEQVTPTIVLDIRSKMQDFNPAQKAVANYILIISMIWKVCRFVTWR